MVKDAELHAEEDRKERERIEVRNEADNLLYSTEKSLKEYGDKISDDEKVKINSAMENLKKSMEDNDTESIKTNTQELQQAAYKLAEEMYKSTSAEQQEGSTEEQTAPKDDGVEDADFEVVD